MTQTSRRVNVTLTAATDEDAHQVMAGVLHAVRTVLPALVVESTNAHAFDLDDAEAEAPQPAVQLVVDAGGVAGAYIDRPGRAADHAGNIGGVVVELPVAADHRGEVAR